MGFMRYVCFGLLVCVCASSQSLTQEVQPKKKGPPPTTQKTKQIEMEQTLGSAGEQWTQAMDALNAPKLMISFGIKNDSPDNAMGLNLKSDDLAYTDGLASLIGSYMSDAYIDTDIIDIDTVHSVKTRIAADMADAGYEAMVDQAMRQVDADLGIIGQFTPLGNNQYRVNAKIVEARTGRKTDIGSFVLMPDVHDIRITAADMFDEIAALTLKTTKRGAPKFNVVIVGDIGDKGFVGLGRKITEIDYVQNSNPVRMDKGPDFYKLEKIQYDGYPLDLGYEISNLLTEEFGVRSNVLLSNGDITLSVYKNTEAPAWYQLTSGESNPKRDLFQELYAEHESPRVAVITKTNAALSQSIENDLAGLMTNAGVNVVDAGKLRELFESKGVSGTPSNSDDMLAKLRDIGGFDVVVLGDALPNTRGIPNVTYRAFMVNSGQLLGSRSWPSREAVEDPKYRADEKNADSQEVARFLAGSILDMFMRNHLIKGVTIEMRVEGVASYRQASFIASSIESVVPGVLSATNVRLDGDVANFTIRYSGERNTLMASLQESISSLPIETKIDQVDAGSLRLRAKPLGSGG